MLHITDIENCPKRSGSYEVNPVKMLLDGKEAFALHPKILENKDYDFAELQNYELKDFESITNDMFYDDILVKSKTSNSNNKKSNNKRNFIQWLLQILHIKTK